jgi:hypothetical protein
MSKRAVEKLVAELEPKPDVPSQMRKLPMKGGAVSAKPVAARAQPSVAVAQQPLAAPFDARAVADSAATQSSAAEAPVNGASPSEFVLEAPRQKRWSCTPLGPSSWEVKFTARDALHAKLEQLQELLRHRVPDGDLAVILELASDLLLAQTMKERFGVKVPSSKATSPSNTKAKATSETEFSLEPAEVTKVPKRNSRHIPRAVLPEVYGRDRGQCSFVSAEGKRCAERGFLEVHHVHPFARGGEATVENLQLMCRVHNGLLAERDFGRALMRSKRSQRGSAHG